MNEDEMQLLREGIRNRYEAYRLEKPGRYPKIKFNSYPTPYGHLQESFREELVRIGKEDMQEALRHIPSTKVFAKIFHEGYLLKDGKLLDTCYLYSWGKTHDALTAVQPKPVAESVGPLPVMAETAHSSLAKKHWRTGLIGLAGLIAGGILIWQSADKPALDLVVLLPRHRAVVPREMAISGKVTNAKTVWVVVRYIKGARHWVQPPIPVDKDGTWRGIVYIGSTDKGDLGLTSQVRAFVNPTQSLAEGDILYAWPDAELVTEPIEVVREGQPN